MTTTSDHPRWCPCVVCAGNGIADSRAAYFGLVVEIDKITKQQQLDRQRETKESNHQ